jgi:cysteine-rich repeat protein
LSNPFFSFDFFVLIYGFLLQKNIFFSPLSNIEREFSSQNYSVGDLVLVSLDVNFDGNDDLLFSIEEEIPSEADLINSGEGVFSVVEGKNKIRWLFMNDLPEKVNYTLRFNSSGNYSFRGIFMFNDYDLQNISGENNISVSVAGFFCGNGMLEGNEECDDENNLSGDGCNQTCFVENGWGCSGEPSVCSEVDCVESWVCGDWSSCENSVKKRNCTDSNQCGTIENRPRLSINCDSSTPTGGGSSSSGSSSSSGASAGPSPPTCSPDWVCFWGDCVNNTNEKVCVDMNGCGTNQSLPSEMSATCSQNTPVEPTPLKSSSKEKYFFWYLLSGLILLMILVLVIFFLMKNKNSPEKNISFSEKRIKQLLIKGEYFLKKNMNEKAKEVYSEIKSLYNSSSDISKGLYSEILSFYKKISSGT